MTEATDAAGKPVVFDLVDHDDLTGEQQMAKIAEQAYAGRSASMTSLLFRRRGSVIIRVLPVSLLGAFFAFCLVMFQQIKECPKDLKQADKEGKEYDPSCWMLPELYHPFVVQIFGIILSFVIVARNNVAVDRYFDGMEQVHTMSSRWVDAFTSLMGFLRSSMDLHPPNSKKQEACVAIGLAMLHWGTLAHAIAVNSLQATQLGVDERIWEYRLTVLEPPENITLDSSTGYEGVNKTKSRANRSRSRAVKGAMTAERRVSITETGIPKEKSSTSSMRELGKLGVYGPVSQDEVTHLHGATDKVSIVLMWMEEAISRGQVQGVILTAPPILGRVYNELGSGLQGFNSAYRIALVPFPFCFAQMIGWCLVIFELLCPIVAYAFTGGEVLTSFLTFCSLMGFWGLNRIAIELENPFGVEVNHLPLAELHHAYVEALGEMHVHPMPEYKWSAGNDQGQLPQLRRTINKG
jgi:predicted membrane chloride channel (bestrophin family)